MCIIIDNNVVARVLTQSGDPDFSELHAALFNTRGSTACMVYGGKLKTEYVRNHSVRRLLVLLDRAGRARAVDDRRVDEEEANVRSSGLCESDDEHVIGLARVAGVRLLCSHDQALHADFTNRALLSKPRGKVYQGQQHAGLLKRACAA